MQQKPIPNQKSNPMPKVPQQAKPHKPPIKSQIKPEQKSQPSYRGQSMVRVELSPIRVHGCSATEFLAWIRQQEGGM